MHQPKSFVVDKKKNKTQQHPNQVFNKRHNNIQILTEEQANVVLWPGRASGTVFGCGAGSMLLGILLLTPVRVRLERLSAASWSMLTALLFIIILLLFWWMNILLMF